MLQSYLYWQLLQLIDELDNGLHAYAVKIKSNARIEAASLKGEARGNVFLCSAAIDYIKAHAGYTAPPQTGQKVPAPLVDFVPPEFETRHQRRARLARDRERLRDAAAASLKRKPFTPWH